MKEQLYTIPVTDAFREQDECPFCYIERNLEQHALDFVLGSSASYMQYDIRQATDEAGFCRDHMKKMFTYGNSLGNATIMQTHMKKKLAELKKEMKHFSSKEKPGLLERVKIGSAALKDNNNVSKWIHTQTDSCYICNHMRKNWDRYIETFFVLYKRGEREFMELMRNGKGFCLPHFAELLEAAPLYLNGKEQKELRDILFPQMEANLERILDDVEWFRNKFDYRYRDEDWKNSRDAVQRSMQKMGGGYPADEPYQAK